jgi:hypothetical protein
VWPDTVTRAPIIPAIWEAEIGGSWLDTSS